MFEVAASGARAPEIGSETFLFGRGGNQGGEGNDGAGEWFIENVISYTGGARWSRQRVSLHWFHLISSDEIAAFLLAPNEYYYDRETRQLHLYYNGTGAAPPASVVVPKLANMIVVKGTKAVPSANITIGPGLQFRDNRP